VRRVHTCTRRRGRGRRIDCASRASRRRCAAPRRLTNAPRARRRSLLRCAHSQPGHRGTPRAVRDTTGQRGTHRDGEARRLSEPSRGAARPPRSGPGRGPPGPKASYINRLPSQRSPTGYRRPARLQVRSLRAVGYRRVRVRRHRSTPARRKAETAIADCAHGTAEGLVDFTTG
jgi:hypothetical protein